MVYIPFMSLLGIQDMLGMFTPKTQLPVLKEDSVTPINFINPKPEGGSFLDKDTNSGLREPLSYLPCSP